MKILSFIDCVLHYRQFCCTGTGHGEGHRWRPQSGEGGGPGAEHQQVQSNEGTEGKIY